MNIRLEVMKKMRVEPGPRYMKQGEGSGEEFRIKHLAPCFEEAVAQDVELEIWADGTAFGYPTSFLEEAFGGLAREKGVHEVLTRVRVFCRDDRLLSEEIEHYVRHCNEERKNVFVRQ